MLDSIINVSPDICKLLHMIYDIHQLQHILRESLQQRYIIQHGNPCSAPSYFSSHASHLAKLATVLAYVAYFKIKYCKTVTYGHQFYVF